MGRKTAYTKQSAGNGVAADEVFLKCSCLERHLLNENKAPNCIVVGSTVTGICTMKNGQDKCDTAMPGAVAAIPVDHTSISGTLSVLYQDYEYHHGDWSRQMVAKRMNRAVSSADIGSIWISFLLDIGRYRWKMINCDVIETIISIYSIAVTRDRE
ncbi:hypothetical protein KIN20_003679 [Parelaphostrongylus tenuis]|uniref:Uncharacterized protein n=1 Tax=Parelaphostrongylus tenuis TaxID=148309 RepID=A0AAD5QHJ5_PARTN|nr:hypothetical protein KIN20_003679 [Parelaphostrongylus tenuis]